uniref:glycosyltransferase n=1 Tax=Klebsiella pneumoniae TaxID=573 RepID=UPI001954C41A
NPDGTIAAFKMAFRPDEPVRLVIKTLNGHRDPVLLKSLEDMAAGHRVTIWDRALETQDRFRLLASVDAFVSLHRAEG